MPGLPAAAQPRAHRAALLKEVGELPARRLDSPGARAGESLPAPQLVKFWSERGPRTARRPVLCRSTRKTPRGASPQAARAQGAFALPTAAQLGQRAPGQGGGSARCAAPKGSACRLPGLGTGTEPASPARMPGTVSREPSRAFPKDARHQPVRPRHSAALLSPQSPRTRPREPHQAQTAPRNLAGRSPAAPTPVSRASSPPRRALAAAHRPPRVHGESGANHEKMPSRGASLHPPCH